MDMTANGPNPSHAFKSLLPTNLPRTPQQRWSYGYGLHGSTGTLLQGVEEALR